MKQINYSPDEVAGGGADTQEDVGLPTDFDPVKNYADETGQETDEGSSNESDEDFAEVANKGNENSEEATDEEPEQDSSESDDSEEESEEESTEGTPEEEDSDDEGFSLTPPSQEESEEEYATWQTMGERMGFDVEEDSIDSYEESLKNYIQQKIQEEVNNVSYDKFDISDLPPEMQSLVRWSQAVGPEANVQDYYSQLGQYDRLIQFTDDALLEASLSQQGYNEDQIERQLERMEEDGIKDIEAHKLREQLKQAKAERQQEMEQEIIDAEERNEQYLQEIAEKEILSFGNSVDKRNDFLGLKISNDAKSYVKSKFENGDYDQFRTDPDRFLDLVLLYEFGDKAAKELAKSEFQKGNDGLFDKLSNSPDTKKGKSPGTGKTEAGNQVDKTGTFSDWDAIYQESGASPN